MSIALVLSAKGGMEGAIRIGGMPYTAELHGQITIINAGGFTLAANNIFKHAKITAQQNYAELQIDSNTTTGLTLDASAITDSFGIYDALGIYLM